MARNRGTADNKPDTPLPCNRLNSAFVDSALPVGGDKRIAFRTPEHRNSVPGFACIEKQPVSFDVLGEEKKMTVIAHVPDYFPAFFAVSTAAGLGISFFFVFTFFVESTAAAVAVADFLEVSGATVFLEVSAGMAFLTVSVVAGAALPCGSGFQFGGTWSGQPSSSL
jgi:hypothetical protein